MLTHVKELIEQNAEKMRLHWKGAPLGIYSSGLGIRQLDEPITFAGIQSVRNRAQEIGHVDLIIIDECHLVNHKDEGGYRNLINGLKAINAAMRVVGLTATPYRLGHGLITSGDALFDALIEPTSIEELVHKRYISRLRSKVTDEKLNTDGVHKRGGEYIESELQAAVDKKEVNESIVQEVIRFSGKRKAWLFFCAGVDHAKHICDELNAQGIAADCIFGETPKKQREQILNDFKSGKLRALTNANVLTTGFDYPDIDLIAMLRPTMSPGLYVQMAGRGLRLKSHTDHCLVLDFAGVVEKHGPITNVVLPTKAGDGNRDPPVKVCDHCHEIVAISVMICPACGMPFPEREKKALKLHHHDIMGATQHSMNVNGWKWKEHISRASGNKMLAVTYYGAFSDPPITEYLPVLNQGYAGNKAAQLLHDMALKSGARITDSSLIGIADSMTKSQYPNAIDYEREGKFYRVRRREWTR